MLMVSERERDCFLQETVQSSQPLHFWISISTLPLIFLSLTGWIFVVSSIVSCVVRIAINLRKTIQD